jgi:hypothetical protein
MKLIIAGSRGLHPSVETIHSLIKKHGLNPTEIVCGEADGVDLAGKDYANYHGIPVKSFAADWSTFGLSAGPIRNRHMAEYADALLLIWNGQSRGSFNMKATMLAKNKPVFESNGEKP